MAKRRTKRKPNKSARKPKKGGKSRNRKPTKRAGKKLLGQKTYRTVGTTHKAYQIRQPITEEKLSKLFRPSKNPRLAQWKIYLRSSVKTKLRGTANVISSNVAEVTDYGALMIALESLRARYDVRLVGIRKVVLEVWQANRS